METTMMAKPQGQQWRLDRAENDAVRGVHNLHLSGVVSAAQPINVTDTIGERNPYMSTATENRQSETQVRDPAASDAFDAAEELLGEAMAEEAGIAGQATAQACSQFVLTKRIEEMVERALTYLGAGFPLNLEGNAGSGKTTLALHLAEKIGRPVTLIHGDDELGTSDLVGNNQGYRTTKLIDQFIHSVMKTEQTVRTFWAENRLTTAVREGHTLIYDEFTRSRPEANNVLLSVLSEGLLDLSQPRDEGDGYVKAHPEFRAIFTCNPSEYAGVHRGQDALLDRLVPIRMDDYDRQTEALITVAKSGVSTEDAERIVDVVRYFRRLDGYIHRPSVRAAIMIAKVTAYRNAKCDPDDPLFQRTCRDALGLEEPRKDTGKKPFSDEVVREGIRKAWSSGEVADGPAD
jgi:gas vesicle protein GvpN